MLAINETRLLERIHALGAVGIDADGRRTRLAASDEDKAGRDLVSRWMREAGLTVVTDYIGNLFGIWTPEGCAETEPVMTGSHIDTVINAGQFDGCYGVLAALEVVEFDFSYQSVFRFLRSGLAGRLLTESGTEQTADEDGAGAKARGARPAQKQRAERQPEHPAGPCRPRAPGQDAG